MIEPLGEVTLPLSLGSYPKRSTKMVKFLVVKAPSAYNIILGRPGLNTFRAVASTYHMKLKFPTPDGIGEATGDERMARECYANTLKRSWEKLGEIEADKKGKMKLNETNHGAKDPPADAWENPRTRRVEAVEGDSANARKALVRAARGTNGKPPYKSLILTRSNKKKSHSAGKIWTLREIRAMTPWLFQPPSPISGSRKF
ncbi:UNVERIFIED_CONTAM: hypothetical protein Sradi_4029100 [Sesamum radiatum]|uniref:Uncharacterized protein n=1 Tax=Sesamum radiatum TaxID=300843 RepID=A0AAW2PIW6_SESRA